MLPDHLICRLPDLLLHSSVATMVNGFPISAIFGNFGISGNVPDHPITRDHQITRSPVTSPRSSTSSFSPRTALPAQCSGIPYTGTNFPPARGVSLHPSDQDCAAESALPP